jgi:hypothetical protein
MKYTSNKMDHTLTYCQSLTDINQIETLLLTLTSEQLIHEWKFTTDGLIRKVVSERILLLWKTMDPQSIDFAKRDYKECIDYYLGIRNELLTNINSDPKNFHKLNILVNRIPSDIMDCNRLRKLEIYAQKILKEQQDKRENSSIN